MGFLNRRGMASLAAVLMAAVVGGAALEMATMARAREAGASERLMEARARARLLERAIRGRASLPDDGHAVEWTAEEPVGSSSLRVAVTWKKTAGAWRADTWMEVRTWPAE